MSVLDLSSLFVLVGLIILRFGVPIIGMWLLGQGLKRLLPSTP